MKNATKHAQGLKALAKKLAKQQKAEEPRPALDPLRGLVLGILREAAPDLVADAAITRIDEEYVDFNELRVATELELEDLLEEYYNDAADRALRIKDILAAIFDAEGRLSLERVTNLSKREQRPALRKACETAMGFTDYVEAHAALTSLGIGVVPIDAPTHAYLEAEGILEPQTPLPEVQKFVEQNLKLDECWPFYLGCRSEVFSTKTPAKKTAKKASRKESKRTTKKAS